MSSGKMDARFVTIRVENWKATKRFYGELLGLTEKFSDDANEYAMFEAGSMRIAIEGPARPAHKLSGKAGAMMLNFLVEELSQVASTLRACGVNVITDIKQGPGYDYMVIRDPEGNEHVVFQRTTPPEKVAS